MLNNEKTAISQPQLAQINLAGLPSQLQVELIDFYEFLIQKYHINEKALEPEPSFKRFLDTPIQVPEIKTWTRDELHER
ncbi:MAG: hypothetical protein QX195_00080 [Methylococcaceae bacterium]